MSLKQRCSTFLNCKANRKTKKLIKLGTDKIERKFDITNILNKHQQLKRIVKAELGAQWKTRKQEMM